MINRTIQQEHITLVNIYTPNIGAPKYVKQILMNIKGEIDRNTVIFGDFSTPLSSMDRCSRQEINKEMMALNDTLNRMDSISIFRAFHPKAAEYTQFSSAHGTFSRTYHVVGHKINLQYLSKFNKIEIISSIFPDHNAMKLEINHKNTEIHIKTWKLNNMLIK